MAPLAGAAAAAAAAAAIIALWIVLARSPATQARVFTVSFLDVGQGDATLFRAPGGPNVLIDGGPPEGDVARRLRALGVRSLDVVVLTHSQRDHEGGLEAVLRELPVRLLLDGGAGSSGALHDRVIATARAHGTRVVMGAAGQVLSSGDLRIRVLSPPRDSRPDRDADPNLRALVLLVSYRSLDLFMPADAESEVTAALPLRRMEVLKVAHHGSADEGLAALLERLRPRAAVIEVGASNPYGHPAPSTLATLARQVPRVLRTDLDGEVTMTLEGASLKVAATAP